MNHMTRYTRAATLISLLLLQACDRSGTNASLKDRLHVAKDGAYCSLDSIDGRELTATASVKRNELATFTGWVGDSTKQTPPSVTVVLLNDTDSAAIEGITGTARNDVVQALNAPALGNSGFAASAKLSLQPGTYAVTLLMHAAGGDERCSTHRSIIVD
jgi:hypothetical protein